MGTQRARRKTSHLSRPTAQGSGPAVGAIAVSTLDAPVAPSSAATDQSRAYWITASLVTVVLVAWLFGPTLVRLVRVWNVEPDYSHGLLVAPFSALMLWWRRDLIPKNSPIPGWGGISLLAVSFGIRYVGERLFLTPLAGWALVFWL